MKAYKGGKFSDENVDPNLLKVIKKHEKEGRTVVPNESGIKFSEMLLELVAPYYDKFSVDGNLESLLSLALIAWNIGSIKIGFPQLYKIMLGQAKVELGDNKEDIKLLEKLIKERVNRFSSHGEIIHDFEINRTDDGQFFVSVTARPLTDFLDDMMLDEEEDDEHDEHEDDDYNFEEGFINRTAITVKPRQLFLDWLQKAQGNTLFPQRIEEDNIYLIEEKDTDKEIESYLRKNFDKIFMQELSLWYEDENLWPEKRNYKMFREWFDVVYSSTIYDLEDSPVEKG